METVGGAELKSRPLILFSGSLQPTHFSYSNTLLILQIHICEAKHVLLHQIATVFILSLGNILAYHFNCAYYITVINNNVDGTYFYISEKLTSDS